MQNDVFYKYLKYLANQYSTIDFQKILLADIGIRVYPLLCSKGIHFTEPIGLVADSSAQLGQIYDELAGFTNAREAYASLDMKKTELEALYRNNEYELFYVDYYGGKKCEENLRYFRTLCHSPKSERCISLVGFCGFVPPESINCLAGILYIQAPTVNHSPAGQQNLRHEFTSFLLHYAEKNQTLIFREIERQMAYDDYRQNEGNMGYRFFTAANALFKLLLEDLKCQKRTFQMSLDDVIQKLSSEFEFEDIDSSDIKKLFHRMLFNAAKDIPKIIDREKVPSEDIENLDKLPLYDRNYYYIPEIMLREICKPWTETISFTRIKNLLKSAGLIVAQGGKREYFTVKVQAVVVYGNIIKTRAVKIPRENIDQPVQLSWAEVIQTKGEHYEN